MNPIILLLAMGKLERQPVKEKEKSEFQLVELHLKIDLVSTLSVPRVLQRRKNKVKTITKESG